MASYDLLKDFGGSSESPPDQISMTPYGVMAVWRYKNPVTFSRTLMKSYSKSPKDAEVLRDPALLLVVEDLIGLSTGATKSTHVSTLQATLLPGANYLVEIMPGDWVMAWIVNGTAKTQSIIDRLKTGKACNEFDDGLKFIGRVQDVRKNISMDSNGQRTTRYSVTASGGLEFDAQLYYEPYLASNSVGLATDWLRHTGVAINKLIASNKNGGLDINEVLPALINVFFGQGVPKNLGNSAGPDVTKGLDNPNVFVVPSPVAATLGVTTGTKSDGRFGWLDICNIIWGIQKYDAVADDTWHALLPDGQESFSTDTPAQQIQLPASLLGFFLPSPPQFEGGRTVWSVLEQFKNPAINEMYLTLKVGTQGKILPTFVARQLPFSSDLLRPVYTPKPPAGISPVEKDKTVLNGLSKEDLALFQKAAAEAAAPRTVDFTRYSELPRWKVPPIMLRSLSVGRSEGMRFNFVHVYGESGQSSATKTAALVRDPPVADDLDIFRSGLKPYSQTVACAPRDVVMRQAGVWMYLLSDILMGQHLTLTGTASLVGVQSPICPGDNMEIDGHTFHIEAVSHTFQVQTSLGIRSWNTNFALSHGMKPSQTSGQDTDMYSGLDSNDFRDRENVTMEYRVNRREPVSDPGHPSFGTDQDGKEEP